MPGIAGTQPIEPCDVVKVRMCQDQRIRQTVPSLDQGWNDTHSAIDHDIPLLPFQPTRDPE